MVSIARFIVGGAIEQKIGGNPTEEEDLITYGSLKKCLTILKIHLSKKMYVVG